MPEAGRTGGGPGNGHRAAHDPGGLAVCRRGAGQLFPGAIPGLPLGQTGPGGWLEWGGGRYEVMSVRPIWVGGQVTHLWMALRACGENAP